VFVCDAGAHRIRRVDPASLNISTFAGDGTAGVGADGTALTSTNFIGPNDMDFTHDGGLYVTDGGRVRKLVPPNPLLPGGANVTVAGDAGGATGSSGDDGPALSARFRVLTGISVALDVFDPTAEKLVVCDYAAHTVRLVDLTNDKVRLLAGQHDVPGYSGDFSTSPGLVDSPTGIVALPSQIIFVDSLNERVRTRIFPAGFP
jgi:DNA-binding beta-propeller fold protein YncE